MTTGANDEHDESGRGGGEIILIIIIICSLAGYKSMRLKDKRKENIIKHTKKQ